MRATLHPERPDDSTRSHKAETTGGCEPLTGCNQSYSKKKIQSTRLNYNDIHLPVDLHLHHKELGQKTCQPQPKAMKLELAGKHSKDP